ncbi:MAG TPA: hypothetical protein VHA52_04950 [Candidatus Babeliaceae bacterium]|nr:hypothetical protein [Candidatus Babeliaceae bacterium]
MGNGKTWYRLNLRTKEIKEISVQRCDEKTVLIRRGKRTEWIRKETSVCKVFRTREEAIKFLENECNL